MADLVTVDEHGLYCARGGFHIDPWGPAPRALLTHVHGDHARPGAGRYLVAAPSLPLARRRLGEAPIDALAYGTAVRLGDVDVSFHPAGHILGSAQLRLEADGEVWVVSGDYKRAPDPTCAPLEPLRCHTFVTEATFALPIYRWDAPSVTMAEILAWWDECRGRGQAAVLFCYVLGKAQRLLAELARLTDRTVWLHGMMEGMTGLYREAGIALAPTKVVVKEPKRGAFAGDLVLAPPSARATPWAKRFGDYSSAFAGGEMRVRGTRRRQGYDRGFALSDHADWPALLATVAETGASRVLCTHGHAETLARHLREQGLQAETLATRYGDEETA